MTEEVGTTRRKKSGFPNQTAFDDPQLVHSFSKISRALIDSKNLPFGLEIDEKSLAAVSFNLQTFMEAALGKNSTPPSIGITKIPQSHFRDFSVDGSLMSILMVALKHQLDAGWKSFNLSTGDRFSHGVEIIRDAEATLLESRMLRRPRVFFGRVPGNIIHKLRKIVLSHGGFIIDDITTASHVIDWDDEVDSLPSELTEEFVRTLEVRPCEDGGTALVHWFYHPDSYDEWIPSDHVDGSEPPDTVPQPSDINTDRQWHVCCRYIMDCEIFNEWGNEIDYENLPEGEGDDDEANEENTQERSPIKASAGRKARGRRRLDAVKAKKIPILESIAATEKMMQDVPPPLLDPSMDTSTVIDILTGNECQLTLVKYESVSVVPTASSSSASDAVGESSVSEDQDDVSASTNAGTGKRKAEEIQSTSTDTSTSVKAATASAAVVKLKKDKTAGRKASYPTQLKLPTWYHSELLNALEIKHLPDLFSTEADRLKNSPEYFRIRNFIVTLYAHNPSVYLSATDCRRKQCGDVCVVLRIHAFLDAFGAINFNIKADCRPLLKQASLTHWSEDCLLSSTTDSVHIPSYAPQGSSSTSNAEGTVEEFDIEWSEQMDRSLRHRAVAANGDWNKVAIDLASEYAEGSSSVEQWQPTPEECLVRFVSLSLPAPSFPGTMAQCAADLALTSIACGPETQKMRFVASLISNGAISTLGREATKTLMSNSMAIMRSQVSSVPIDMSSDDDLKDSIFSCDHVTFRLDAMEQKIKLIGEVDRSIDLERDRLEIDMRDIQMQRAQLCLLR